jgi:hypothetical protein
MTTTSPTPGAPFFSVALLQTRAGGTYSGKRFVVYQYAVSMIVLSTLHVSPYEVLGAADRRFVRGLKYSAMSFLAGWWSIPHGPIFTIVSIVRNCRGGVDLTPAVRAALTGTAISGGR